MTASSKRALSLRLLCGTAATLFLHGAALAAPFDRPAAELPAAAPLPPSDEGQGGSDVIVTGRRVAVEKAQGEQFQSQSLATVVSGEELRAQPQQNLADLLTRLPGVNSSVDQSRNAAGTGEAQYLSIRGLDTAYNAYMLDGVRLAQTDARTRRSNSPSASGKCSATMAPCRSR